MRIIYGIAVFLVIASKIFSQGNIFGGLQLNEDFYVRDEKVGAANTPHYDNLKSSTDGWLNLDYVNDRFQFDLGMRLDIFNNSNLHKPGTPYSAIGIGNWYVRKRIKSFRITGGYFYDQFGSGIAFRAYEDRTLGIDNAILGLHLEYDLLEKLKVKAFTGVQKNRLSIFKPIITGLNLESNLSIKDKVQFIPGAAVVNRTMDQNSIEFVVKNIETFAPEDRFVPKYNVYVFTAYNTLNIGGFSWYVEGAGKTTEAISNFNGDSLLNRKGYVLYSTMNYTIKKFGVALQFKRTKDFPFKTSPNQKLLEGDINYIPLVSRQNSLRLPARYNAVSQRLEEMAYSADITFTLPKKITFDLNYSESRNFEKELLFREGFANMELKMKRAWKAEIGLQYIEYEQEFYEREVYGNYRLVRAFTPFFDFTWKVNRKHSLRFEAQWQVPQNYSDSTGKNYRADFGSWIFGLIEYDVAPWFSIAVSDMYNYELNPLRFEPNSSLKKEKIHYYSFFTSFTWDSHVLSLSYVRQVEGIVCTGGVCRYEPAFNGAKISLVSTF